MMLYDLLLICEKNVRIVLIINDKKVLINNKIDSTVIKYLAYIIEDISYKYHCWYITLKEDKGTVIFDNKSKLLPTPIKFSTLLSFLSEDNSINTNIDFIKNNDKYINHIYFDDTRPFELIIS